MLALANVSCADDSGATPNLPKATPGLVKGSALQSGGLFQFICRKPIGYLPDFIKESSKYPAQYETVRNALWAQDAQLGFKCRSHGLLFLVGARPNEAVPDVIKFAELRYAKFGEHWSNHVELMGDAIDALGWALRASKLEPGVAQQAFEYLKSSLDVDQWKARNVAWGNVDAALLARIHHVLVSSAISGLGVSDHPGALDLLVSMLDTPGNAAKFPFLEGWSKGLPRRPGELD